MLEFVIFISQEQFNSFAFHKEHHIAWIGRNKNVVLLQACKPQLSAFYIFSLIDKLHNPYDMYFASFNRIAGMCKQKFDFLIACCIIAAQVLTFRLLSMQFEAELKVAFPVSLWQELHSFSKIR
ncbi:hypothetical protein D3C78_1092650 [compost metagenome]